MTKKKSGPLKTMKKIERREKQATKKFVRAADEVKRAPEKRAPKSAKFGKMAGETIASLLPAPFNALASPVLGKLGEFVGDKAGTFLGSGDYETNSLIDLVKDGKPLGSTTQGVSYVHSQNDEVHFYRREDLGPIFAASTPGEFKINRFRVQAADRSTFPYLNKIARLHQNWRPEGMIFQFESQTGPISSQPNLGVVAMGMEYDAAKPAPFASIQQIDNSWGGFAVKTTDNCAFGVECKLGKNVLDRLYVRNDSSLDQNHDPQFYDLGTFCIATEGQPVANQQIGRLWVSYEIVLSKPILDRETFGDPRVGQWRMDLSAAALGSGNTFLHNDESLNDTDYALIGDTNNFELSLELPEWLNPDDYPAGSFLHFPDISPGTYEVNICFGLSGTAATSNCIPESYADRLEVGPFAVVDGQLSSLLTGGDSLSASPVCYATPQAGAANGNLTHVQFCIDVLQEKPTLAFRGMGPRTVAWTWVKVASIPRSQTSFSLAPATNWVGMRQAFPAPKTTPADVLVHERNWRGEPVSLVLRDSAAKLKTKGAPRKPRPKKVVQPYELDPDAFRALIKRAATEAEVREVVIKRYTPTTDDDTAGAVVTSKGVTIYQPT